MLLQSYLSLGALAATANALLVPLNSADLAANEVSVTRGPQAITLDCSTCPYALKNEVNGQRAWSDNVASNLEMKFDVTDNTLRMNGVPVYPVTQPGVPPVLTVSQKAKDSVELSAGLEGYGKDLRLSYGLEMAQKKFDDGNTLVTLTMSTLALDGKMVRVDDVEVKIIKDAAGTLTLHSVNTIAPFAADAQCGNVMCRVFSKLGSVIQKAKAGAKTAAHKMKCLCVKCFRCVMRLMGHKMHHHQHKGPEVNVRPDGTVELPSHIHFKPQDGRPHPHHRHGWHNKSFFRRMGHILWVTVKIAFIPILIGVAFGMAASAVGMLVGQAVVFLWMRYRRTDDVLAYEALPTDEKEEVPPPYEDLPTAVQEAINEKDVKTKA